MSDDADGRSNPLIRDTEMTSSVEAAPPSEHSIISQLPVLRKFNNSNFPMATNEQSIRRHLLILF
jgi:hypothetical protein